MSLSIPQVLLYVAGGSCRGRGRGHDNQNCYLAIVFVLGVAGGQWPTHFYEGNEGQGSPLLPSLSTITVFGQCPSFVSDKGMWFYWKHQIEIRNFLQAQDLCRKTSKIRFQKARCLVAAFLANLLQLRFFSGIQPGPVEIFSGWLALWHLGSYLELGGCASGVFFLVGCAKTLQKLSG